ncbi:MAG: glycosyltransferase family 2 protein [Thermodesulfovibrionales bacterium]|nr:glycosyltransferase family 2 protein [Nitrospinota bacterium]MCG2709128.1 glycosyltransferase family 2 protein [Thermodesulfovibrionales bacterium]MCG2814274.1 glycosyltransferase family 2 protein [Thermodesulfovibrionales bacterium]
MKASVIISAYNRPEYLQRTIEGYLSQSCLPDEIVIADDGSTAETASLIFSLSRNSPVKFLHVWHEDEGFRAAKIRNKAIAKSSGEYLILCDDDSIPVHTMVEDHLKFSEKGCFIQGHRALLGQTVSQDFTFKDISLMALFYLMLKGQAGNILNAVRLPLPLIKVSQSLKGIRSCNMSFFRKDIIAVNGFNEDFKGCGKEDSELAVRFYKYGLRRKDIKFRACCYHLYHRHYSRDSLERNLALLEKAKSENGYFCKNGIDKYLQGL